MNISRTVVSTAVLAAFVGVASPALAQHHRGSDGSRGSEGSGSAVRRDESRPAPRESSAQRERSAPQESSAQRERGAPRESNAPRQVAPRAETTPRGYSTSPREYSRGPRDYSSAPRAYAVPRAYSAPPRAYSNERGGVYRNFDSPRNFDSRRGFFDSRGFWTRSYAPIRFYRPYYLFRPRLSLGFGLWVGYPFPYYDPFYYPDYYYTYPYPYPYPPAVYPTYPPAVTYPQSAYPPAAYPGSASGSIEVQPDPANTGGVSFDITPGDAELFVDGNAVGTVDQFTPTSQPLGLAAGRHRVEVRAPGYRTITFDVNIVAGQVIPYQGNLER